MRQTDNKLDRMNTVQIHYKLQNTIIPSYTATFETRQHNRLDNIRIIKSMHEYIQTEAIASINQSSKQAISYTKNNKCEALTLDMLSKLGCHAHF